MPRYIVEVMERHLSLMLIEEAENEDDAIKRVEQGEGEEISCDYYETEDMSSWAVYEVDEENDEIIQGDENDALHD